MEHADRVGRRPVYIGGALDVAIMAFPFFWMVDTRKTWVIGLAIFLVVVFENAAINGPQAAFFSELFGTRVRYSGISITAQVASVFAGGLAIDCHIAFVLGRWETMGNLSLHAYYVCNLLFFALL